MTIYEIEAQLETLKYSAMALQNLQIQKLLYIAKECVTKCMFLKWGQKLTDDDRKDLHSLIDAAFEK
jgi:hypothetical protein